MEIRYGCFLSYAHGQYAFMNKFKNDLIEALACYLEPHLDREEVLFIDSEQLGGGDDIDLRVARAMCQSVCMIVLYTPKYEAHGYTRREFAAMQLIEQERRGWYDLPSHMIIPIIMTRHPDGLPPQITGGAVCRFFRLHAGQRRPEVESAIPARYRTHRAAHCHALSPAQAFDTAGPRLQPFRLA
ncbi:MAG: toll/interleukin-1 receptor domain-containing protein [Janthinobacterium sp.]